MRIREIVNEAVHRIEARNGGPVPVFENPSERQLMMSAGVYGTDIFRFYLESPDPSEPLWAVPVARGLAEITHLEMIIQMGLSDNGIPFIGRIIDGKLYLYTNDGAVKRNRHVLRLVGDDKSRIQDKSAGFDSDGKELAA